MNILIVYRHFWPDSPPYASMLRSISRRLSSDGHSISVLCEQPCYKSTDSKLNTPSKEKVDGVSVIRLRRVLFWRYSTLVQSVSKLLFPFRAWLYCRKKLRNSKFDLVWVATIPPVLSGYVGRKLSRQYNAMFLYHCQDLYPEIAVHMNMMVHGGLMHRLLSKVEKTSREEADVVVSLSDDMKRTIESLAVESTGRHVTLNNFLLENFDEKEVRNDRRNNLSVFSSSDKVKVIFAGNIGQFQGLENVVEAILRLGEDQKHMEVVFIGEGKALPLLKEKAKGVSSVSFYPHMPFVEVESLIATADYGLVSLERGIYKYAFPSKTLTYLGLSVPLAVVVEGNSEIATNIGRYSIGYCASEMHVDAIKEMFQKMLDNSQHKSVHKINAKDYYQTYCTREKILDRWSLIISDMERKCSLNA